jgi:REP element-mobilizing transposase RayT
MDKFQNKYRIPSARLQSWDYRWAGAYFITICTKNRFHYFGEIHDGKMQLSHIGIIADILWYQIPHHTQNVELGEFVVMPNHIHGILIITNDGNDDGNDDGNRNGDGNGNGDNCDGGGDGNGNNGDGDGNGNGNGNGNDNDNANGNANGNGDGDGNANGNGNPNGNGNGNGDGNGDGIVETGHALSLQSPNQSPNQSPHQSNNQPNNQPDNQSDNQSESIPKTIGQQRFQNIGKNSISSIVGSYKSAVSKHAHRLGFEFQWQTRFYDNIIRDDKSFQKITSYITNNPKNWQEDKFLNAK